VRTVYLDYNATTPLDPAVREAMLPFLGAEFGNPSSVHHVGRRARALLDDCRDRLAHLWRAKPSEVVFTSGGTESNNLAIFGTARLLARRDGKRHLITSRIEHDAVLQPMRALARHEGFTLTELTVSADGFISPDDLHRALQPDTALVSLMAANNETGAIQPVAKFGAICRERGVLFHTDAVQWFGKEPFASIHQFNADLVSACAHKFHGPKGAGALFIRSPLLPDATQLGGAHENERRAGTENLAAIAGFTEAFARFVPTPVFHASHLTPHTSHLRSALVTIPGVTVRSPREHCLANTLAFTVAGADSIALLAALDLEGICASSGSACSAGSIEPSHVMTAMGVPPAEANALIRFSTGRETTAEDIAHTARVLPALVARIQAANKH
jgi:cysteine desulfurase